jgi:hypothetical protein
MQMQVILLCLVQSTGRVCALRRWAVVDQFDAILVSHDLDVCLVFDGEMFNHTLQMSVQWKGERGAAQQAGHAHFRSNWGRGYSCSCRMRYRQYH